VCKKVCVSLRAKGETPWLKVGQIIARGDRRWLIRILETSNSSGLLKCFRRAAYSSNSSFGIVLFTWLTIPEPG